MRPHNWPPLIPLAGVVLLLGLILGPAGTPAQSPPTGAAASSLANSGFEEGLPGGLPVGWLQRSKSVGYDFQLDPTQPARGKLCLRISAQGNRPPESFGNLMQTLDATPYRGKRIRFRAAVRAEVEEGKGRAQLWVRVDRVSRLPGFFDNMADRPVTSPAWDWYEIVGDVPKDAEKINVGFMLLGDGQAWIDSASFEAISDAGFGDDPPRPLTDRRLENLVAVTRLLGYLRFFHPSDQAAKAQWQDWALAGVQVAEAAESPEELAEGLDRLFHPLAPTVRIFPTGSEPAPVDFSRPDDPKPRVLTWNHFGVELLKNADNPFKSLRIDNRPFVPSGFGSLSQSVNAGPYRGKRVRFRAAVRAEVGEGGRAHLRLRVSRADGQVVFYQNMHDRPITSPEWKVYEITGDVAADASEISVGIMLYPRGQAWIDAAALEVVGEEKAVGNVLQNADFEEPIQGEVIPSWAPVDLDRRKGFVTSLCEGERYSGRQAACLTYREPTRHPIPRPEEPFAVDLEGGISARIPLSVYADAEGTLPRSPDGFRTPTVNKPKGFVPNGNDRVTRLAAVALTWGVFQHFYPYFDVAETDWDAALRRALQSASTDRDEMEFLRTLRLLTAETHDGQGVVSSFFDPRSYRLPLIWDWVEDRLTITTVDPKAGTGLAPGDVVLRIGGRPAWQALAEQEAQVAASTPHWKRQRALSELAFGPEGQPVELEVQRAAGGDPVTLILRRSIPGGSLMERRPDKIAEVQPGVFYVDLGRVSDGEFNAARDRLSAARGIVFDLRDIPKVSENFLRHFLDGPASSPQWQIPVVTRPDRVGMQFETSSWTLFPERPRIQAKLAFLADSRTVGAGEICLGIVDHYRLGAIVGTPTAGSLGNLMIFSLPGSYFVNWTAMRVLDQNGVLYHGRGILPTIAASRTLRGVTEGRDEALERAIETVSR